MSLETLNEGDTRPKRNSNAIVGIISVLALIVAIGAGAFAWWSMNQSQAQIDAITVQLESAQAELATIDATVDAGVTAITIASNEATSQIDATGAESILEMEDAANDAIHSLNSLLPGVLSDVSAAATASASASAAVGDVESDLDELRDWVGDLAHCLVLEAQGGSYSYWETGSSFLGNRGTGDFFVDEMSHCQ